MRQQAWLDAVPDSDDDNPSRRSRRTMLAELYGVDVFEMPPCSAIHVVAYLFEIGPSMSNGDGEGPVTHGEIRAWMDNTGCELSSWEASTLYFLSRTYVRDVQSASKADAPAPWLEAAYASPTQELVARRMQRKLMELADL